MLKKKENQNVEPTVKYLIVCLSSANAILQSTPLISAIQQQVEGSEIDYLTNEEYLDLLADNPHLHKLHSYTRADNKLIETLRDEFYDYVIDLEASMVSEKIKRKLGLHAFTRPKPTLLQRIKMLLGTHHPDGRSLALQFFDTVRLFDVEPDNISIDLATQMPDPAANAALHGFISKPYICIATGSPHFTNRLPESKLVDLCRETNCRILLMGNSTDRAVSERIAAQFGERVMSVCDQLGFREIAAIMAGAASVITTDNDYLQVAAATAGGTLFTIWMGTSPTNGNAPLRSDAATNYQQVTNLSCRPCAMKGLSGCAKKHFDCAMRLNTKFISRQ